MKKLLVSLMAVALLCGCAPKVDEVEKTEAPVETESTTVEETAKAEDKATINIKVVDKIEGKELVNTTVETEGELLADVLQNDIDFTITLEDSQYGKYIVEMAGVTATDTNFWVYESDNNKDCIEAGMCMGISETHIEDGDNFTFIYTDTFE